MNQLKKIIRDNSWDLVYYRVDDIAFGKATQELTNKINGVINLLRVSQIMIALKFEINKGRDVNNWQPKEEIQ